MGFAGIHTANEPITGLSSRLRERRESKKAAYSGREGGREQFTRGCFLLMSSHSWNRGTKNTPSQPSVITGQLP